uniref:CAAX prenyl protease 2 n=1 Tax=Taeniopygia guttata TaxID=59729 RepID=A0A674GSL2_TAEGU
MGKFGVVLVFYWVWGTCENLGFVDEFYGILGISSVGFWDQSYGILGISSVGFGDQFCGILGISSVGFWDQFCGILGISSLGFWDQFYGILGISSVGFGDQFCGILGSPRPTGVGAVPGGCAVGTEPRLGFLGFGDFLGVFLGLSCLGFRGSTLWGFWGPPDPRVWALCLGDVRWLRNQVVAPLTEELVFRACMLPMLVPCTGPGPAVLACPLFFGVAHFHHVIEQLRFRHGSVGSIFMAAAFQFSYTAVFGAYTAFLFLRTGVFGVNIWGPQSPFPYPQVRLGWVFGVPNPPFPVPRYIWDGFLGSPIPFSLSPGVFWGSPIPVLLSPRVWGGFLGSPIPFPFPQLTWRCRDRSPPPVTPWG